jgi:hypothetical protein
MPRGISWDTLPNQFDPYDKLSAKRKQETVAAPTTPAPQEHVERKFDLVEDLEAIGRRTAFGTVCGALTGASFGVMEVVRSPKMLTGKSSVGTQKIIAYTTRFAGFFGGYHTARKLLHLYAPISEEMNISVAALLSIAPLAVFPILRPMVPYGIVMVGLDAYSSLTDK